MLLSANLKVILVSFHLRLPLYALVRHRSSFLLFSERWVNVSSHILGNKPHSSRFFVAHSLTPLLQYISDGLVVDGATTFAL